MTRKFPASHFIPLYGEHRWLIDVEADRLLLGVASNQNINTKEIK
ncbi:MAG: hypothetical protein WCS03_06810 [Bacteroidota bacterium]